VSAETANGRSAKHDPMTVSPAAVATARRHVAQRIERFLNGLERAGRPPNRRELHHLREALQGWRRANTLKVRMPCSERINLIPEAAAALATNDAATVDELRAELGRILQEAMP